MLFYILFDAAGDASHDLKMCTSNWINRVKWFSRVQRNNKLCVFTMSTRGISSLDVRLFLKNLG